MSHSAGQDEDFSPFFDEKKRLFLGVFLLKMHLKVVFFIGLMLPCRTFLRGAREATSIFIIGAMSARRRLEVGR